MEQFASYLDSMGLGEMSASLIGLAALSTAFHFIWGFIAPVLNGFQKSLYNMIVRELEVYVADPDYNKINIWIEQNQQYTRFQRTYKIITPRGETETAHDDYETSVTKEKKVNKLVAGYGTIWMFHPKYKLMSISRQKIENKQVYAQTESLYVRFFSFSALNILKFFSAISHLEDDDGPFVYDTSDSYSQWWRNLGMPKKVYPPVGEQANYFLNDIKNFLEKKELYKKRNVPFKRGYLLYGEPGTGKTSIISHLSYKHSLNLYSLKAESISNFSQLMHQIKPNSIIVIEDIDFTSIGKKRRGAGNKKSETAEEPKKKDESTMQQFLNVLDGIIDFNGCIVVATTNKNPDDLDGALIRPGRLDQKIHIGRLNHDSQVNHINHFYESEISPADIPTQEPRTFAELQHLCLAHIESIDDLVENLK